LQPSQHDTSRSSNVDADDVARQQNADDDFVASLKNGCLKLGEDDVGEDNNNFELQQRQRLVCINLKTQPFEGRSSFMGVMKGLAENARLDSDGRRLCNVRTCAALRRNLYRISFTLPVGIGKLR